MHVASPLLGEEPEAVEDGSAGAGDAHSVGAADVVLGERVAEEADVRRGAAAASGRSRASGPASPTGRPYQSAADGPAITEPGTARCAAAARTSGVSGGRGGRAPCRTPVAIRRSDAAAYLVLA